MSTAALVTRGTIWVALACYVTTLVLQTRRTPRAQSAARIIWMAGCVLFLMHVAAAFQFYHDWSHGRATEDTRQQTLERTGLNSGVGIYFNYLFALMWIADCIGWCIAREHFHEGHRVWWAILHTYFLFMIFNGTVVFGHGLTRPAGLILCLVAIAAMIRRTRFRA